MTPSQRSDPLTRGVSLIEVLLGIIIVSLASVATLTHFSYGFGNMNKQGNRRAALERARERLDALMAAGISQIQPTDGTLYWATCTGSPCTWTLTSTKTPETVSVDNLPSQRMETTIQWIDDPSAGTGAGNLDTLALGVKVWFTSNTGTDDNFNRVYIRTLRTP